MNEEQIEIIKAQIEELRGETGNRRVIADALEALLPYEPDPGDFFRAEGWPSVYYCDTNGTYRCLGNPGYLGDCWVPEDLEEPLKRITSLEEMINDD